MTNDNMHIQKHNLSLSHKNQYLNYYISLGYDEQKGYMLNEDFNRYTARINLDNRITDWLLVGIQTFVSFSDYSGEDMSTELRYIMNPFDAAFLGNGEVNQLINGSPSPLAIAESDNFDRRNNLFGNIYAEADFPFLKGLKYKINFYNNHRTTRFYYFYPFSQNFQGEGGKNYAHWYDLSSDNILSYKRRFNDHQVDATLVYGFEKRKNDFTNSLSSVFINPVLGYNRLQDGSSELQQVSSGAWEEKSIYTMARLFYNFKDKYMFTGTVRRDGFSGFSEEYKFGIFPSLALGWVASEEPFFTDITDYLNYLKLRVSYGSIGNRTIGRYQTLAKLSGSFGYVDEYGESIYTQNISSLASSELKWETTTGINIGVDFGLFDSKILGSVEYYNNNTQDLLYEVDLPSIARFTKFPDNLGRIQNTGIEISLSTVNIKQGEFRWTSDFAFSRNRDELKELLGFDNDEDGVEDDLISEGLFINEPLDVVYHYEVDGIYQLNDDIPNGAMTGSYRIVDQNNDSEIDPENDYRILGYRNPSYRFSINNKVSYKNWSLKIFVNAIQGGKDYYYGADNIHFYIENTGFANIGGGLQHFWWNYPKNLDYWLPENVNAKYQTPDLNIPEALMASRWTQRSFMRLQDVSLSYRLKNNFLKQISVENLKLFISGKNLLTLTNWPGWDPETGEGISRTGRPVMRSYTLGFNVEF